MTQSFQFLARRHPAYDELLPHWQFLIDTFEGGPGWLKKHIVRFYKEGDREFEDRLKRAYRDNISRDVVEIWSAHTFKVPVTRAEGAPAAVLDFWKRANRGKDAVSIDDLMREASDKSGAVSPIYLVVDMPAAPRLPEGQVLTQAHAQSLGLRPYAYIVYPTDVLDFGLDEDDEFTWVLIREYKRDDEDPFTASGKFRERFRLWTRTSWHLYEKTGENGPTAYRLVEEGEHPLGRVPVIQLAHKKGPSRYRAIALTEEIAYKDKAVANFESCLSNVICDQTFSQLAIPDAGLIASTEKNAEGRREKMIKMGTRRIFLFNDKAQHAPHFLSPDASQGKLILEAIDRLREQIFEDALLDTEGGQKASRAKTATEASFDFEKLNSALSEKARGLEAAERQLAELVCLWTKTPYEPDDVATWVVYPRRFNVKALADELQEALTVKQVGDLGPTFWQRYLEGLVRKLLPDVSDDDFAAIVEEIKQNNQLAQLLTLGAIHEQALGQAGPLEPGSGIAKAASPAGEDGQHAA
jgi:hypothetical protein